MAGTVKNTAALIAESTANIGSQTTPQSVTQTIVDAINQDIIASMYNRLDDALTPSPINMTKAQLVTAISASTLLKGQIITITDRTDTYPLLIQAVDINKVSAFGIWVNAGTPIAVVMVYTGSGDLFTFSTFFDSSNRLNLKNKIVIADGSQTVGYALISDASGVGTWTALPSTNANAKYQSSVTNPTGMTGGSALMMGLNGAITPSNTGNVTIIITGEYTSDDVSTATNLFLKTGTGTAPINGAGTTGTTQLSKQPLSPSTTLRTPFSMVVNCALTVGTPYWIDMAIKNIANGAVALFNVSITATEQ